MGQAAYKAALYLSGTSTSATGAATTSLSSTVYQITNAARRVVDPDESVTVYDNGVAVDADDFELDYLFGKITFGVAPTGPVTIDYHWQALSESCSVRGVTIKRERPPLDVTTFCTAGTDGGGRRKLLGLREVSVSIDSVDHSQDESRGAWFDELEQTDDIPVVIEFKPDRNSPYAFRVRGFVSMMEDSGEVEGLVTASIEFVATRYGGSADYSRSSTG